MKPVAWLIVASLLTVAGTEAVVVAPPEPASSAPKVVREAPDEFAVPVRTAAQGSLRVFMPAGCPLLPDRSFDLVVHFHGNPAHLQAALGDSNLNAVVAVENRGNLSRPYTEAFAPPGAFGVLVTRITRLVNAECPGPRTTRRVALSAWSAGYAAVGQVLAHDAERIDAVLLADGLHSALMNPETREFPPGALGAFVRFARQAAAGERLFAITHSAIPTRGYASTTEATDYLLERVALRREPVEQAPTPVPGMELQSRAQSNGFHVAGFAGSDEQAHMQHLQAMRTTLFPRLQQRWESMAPPPVASGATPRADPVNVTVEVRDDELCTRQSGYIECRNVAP